MGVKRGVSRTPAAGGTRGRGRSAAVNGRGARPGERGTDLTLALDALRRIVRALGVSSRTAEHSVGVTGAQLLVLQRLAESPANSLNDLAERTFTHQSTVSVVVDRLVERRFVKRTRSRDDARKILLSLTSSGRTALRKAPPPAQTQLVDALGRLPRRDLRVLATGLVATAHEMGLDEGGNGRRASRRD